MFKIITFKEFFKKYKPEYTAFVYQNSKPVCIRNGFIRPMHFTGCVSVAILYMNGNDRLGAVTQFESPFVKECLEEIRDLTQEYPQLIHAKDLALFWNGLNPSNRFNSDGDVYKLYSELQGIFKKAEFREMPYKGCLDGYGLYVDEGILVLPEDFF